MIIEILDLGAPADAKRSRRKHRNPKGELVGVSSVRVHAYACPSELAPIRVLAFIRTRPRSTIMMS